MNYKIRLLLIESARKRKPLTYGEIMNYLGWDHNNPDHRNKLSNLLFEISRYEVAHGRPMLSSMGMYSDLRDHGKSFFKLAEELGLRNKWGILQDDEYAFRQMDDCTLFWKDPLNYKEYLNIPETTISNSPSFFRSEEIDLLNQWGGKIYDKNNLDHKAAKNFLMESVWAKTVFWSKSVISKLEGFDTINWRMWNLPGWDTSGEKSKQVARFKPYTWARIFRKGDDYKDIFFTVGIDGIRKELVIKLDFLYEKSSTLSDEQKSLIQKNIPDNIKWFSITSNNLSDYNWETLIELTVNKFKENTFVYDNLMKVVWDGQNPEEVFKNNLTLKNTPASGFLKLPDLNPSFNHIEKDYLEEYQEKQEIGNSGEELVIKFEKAKLKDYPHLAHKVEKKLDGQGYDIISYDINGNEIFIEVKTTVSNEKGPFDISLNEFIFAEKNTGKYFIYRLYNYDAVLNKADFYVLKDPLNELLFQPTSFRAYYKQK